MSTDINTLADDELEALWQAVCAEQDRRKTQAEDVPPRCVICRGSLYGEPQ